MLRRGTETPGLGYYLLQVRTSTMVSASRCAGAAMARRQAQAQRRMFGADVLFFPRYLLTKLGRGASG